jgi:iron complex transport system ATP-binding protein
MSEPQLEISEVTYEVGGATLVSDLALEVPEGEFVGVVGPNGAGKSTLLRLMGGELLPTRGAVRLRGTLTSLASPHELALMRSMLGSHIQEDIPFTVQMIVETGRHPLRRSPGNSPAVDNAAVRAAMTSTETHHLADRQFSTLSSGERTRVFLARILAQDAPVALLDEPTAALDVANGEQMLSTLAQAVRRGRTVVSVLHDLNAAAYHTDRLVLMSEGKIVADGPPGEVLTADTLSAVYQQPMRVIEHPYRHCPLVLVVGTGQ